jgi:hexokinase
MRTDFVAEFVGSFLAENGLQNQTLPLGLNFGFAVQKTSLSKGKLLSWSKGFSVKNAVGKDVLELLQAAFNRKGVPVHCAAILNDVDIPSWK